MNVDEIIATIIGPMRFMIDLAQSQGEGRVALKDIADRQGLSKKMCIRDRYNEVFFGFAK